MMHSIKKEIVTKFMLLAVSITVSLFILEFVLRIVSPMSPFSPLIPLRPYNKMELHVDLRGVSPVAIHSTNRWGLRGDSVPSEWEKFYTVVTAGGSTTQCFYLDDHKTWPYLLQQKLKHKHSDVWVGNGGLDGQSTRAHVIFMEEAITKIRPDVVIFLVGANDLGLSLSEDARLYGSDFDKTSLKYKIFASSRIVQILYKWKLIIFDKVTVVKKGGHGNYGPKALTNNEIRLPKDLKVMLPSLGEFRENIKKVIRIAKAMNIRVVFLTQPLLYDDSEYWEGIEGGFYWIKKTKNILSAAIYWKLLDIFNKELIEVCRVENVECLDLASIVPHSDLYFYDAFHFNEEGAELAADKVADYLKNN